MEEENDMTEKQLGTATVSGGIARTNYTIPSDELIGDWTLHGTYVENNHYREATDTADFRVRIGTTITVDNVTGNKGENTTFTAHVLHGGNNLVNEGVVQFKLEGNIIGTGNVQNGVATLVYLLPGTAGEGDSITANYLGTSTYGTSVTQTGAVLHVREGVTITVDTIVGNRSGSVTLMCLVEDGEGTSITDTSVEFYVDNTPVGTSSTADTTTGKYSCSYTIPGDAAAGVHTIRCVSSQTNTNLGAEGTGVLRVRMPVTVTIEDVSVNIGGTVDLVAHAVDENNAPVTSGQAAFKLNLELIKDATQKPIMCNVDSNGTIRLSGLACPAGATEGGTYQIKCVYAVNDDYMTATSANGTLTVRKTPVLIVSDVTANRGDTIYLSTSVTYNNENVTEGTVTFILEQT
jgi:hypothetical protein